jgi:hypothetical protein
VNAVVRDATPEALTATASWLQDAAR